MCEPYGPSQDQLDARLLQAYAGVRLFLRLLFVVYPYRHCNRQIRIRQARHH